MQTEVTRLLGIEYPIIQGGMAWVAEYHLAAGVSEAGGLGLIGAASAPADWVRDQVRKAKELTDKPFGVNIMLMSPYADEVAKVIVEEGVKVVTTGAGNPEKYMKMWKEAGVKVIPVVASVALAKRMERCGADALVAEGCEAGGHIGESTTMVLVPQIVDAVNIPVIAAGGIADGRGIAAAFMLGAKGVQMGTHFVVTDESQVHENYKERIIKAKDIDSKVTGRTTGHPVRALRNDMTRKYLELEITETAYATDSEMIFSVVEKLRQGGFRILMDDFGSGYSSLNMLKEAPVDEIKLDMRFLSAADPYGRAEEILHMIITMGNHMKLSIIAEGVETEQQKVMLQGFGCNKAQGYFYARPMREAEYTELLRKEKAEN